MSLENLYYLSQILAVLAIIGSLVFVGIQVRQAAQRTEQANRLAEAELSEAAWTEIGALQNSWHQTAESSEFMFRAMRSADTLSEPELRRLNARLSILVGAIELSWELRQQGLFNAALFDANTRNLTAILSTPGGLHWWRTFGRIYFTNGFGAFLEELAEAAAQKMSARTAG